MAKQINIKYLYLKNFKGIKNLKIDFSKTTNIYGENATGKTTIFDAFTWLMFDKDSQGRTVGDKEANFQIKTYDENGNIMHGLEHSVTSVINVDGRDTILTKIYKEKWTKRRGEAEKQLTGHETLYSIDEVPVKKREYQEKINSIIDEKLFKLISNPLYFSINMKWQDRRKVLLEVIDNITMDTIINSKSNLKSLEKLLLNKDVGDLKKSIAARKKKLNDEIKSIPYRIDELNNSIQEINFEELEQLLEAYQNNLNDIDENLLDSSKVNNEVLKEKDKIYLLKSKLKDIEYRAQSKIDNEQRELEDNTNKFNYEINRLKRSIKEATLRKEYLEKNISRLEEANNGLKSKWYEENSKELHFDEKQFICPVCKRPFKTEDIEKKKKEMQGNFNSNIANKLKQINAEGIGNKEKIEEYQEQIKGQDEDIKAMKEKLAIQQKSKKAAEKILADFKPVLNLEFNEDYQKIKNEIEILEKEISQPVEVNDEISELKGKKIELLQNIDDIKKQLASKEQNEKFKVRISELQNQEKKLAQQIAELEGQEFMCEEFIKTKVELLESSINNKFKYVSFKLFDTQVNGAVNECCEALINGVPFSNSNTASQINAGLDIINALSQHYEVSAPIFIDNRESVNNLIKTDGQVINLIVSKDKKLKVEVI
ncbi:recombinase RecF [Clostridium oceanicum]|uniref:Nuclease SbcCD subunit C n=1 Tax=Clostridium oceanicum TaxID=1543 RepID=A0ABP3UIQ2_9CLOT